MIRNLKKLKLLSNYLSQQITLKFCCYLFFGGIAAHAYAFDKLVVFSSESSSYTWLLAGDNEVLKAKTTNIAAVPAANAWRKISLSNSSPVQQYYSMSTCELADKSTAIIIIGDMDKGLYYINSKNLSTIHSIQSSDAVASVCAPMMYKNVKIGVLVLLENKAANGNLGFYHGFIDGDNGNVMEPFTTKIDLSVTAIDSLTYSEPESGGFIGTFSFMNGSNLYISDNISALKFKKYSRKAYSAIGGIAKSDGAFIVGDTNGLYYINTNKVEPLDTASFANRVYTKIVCSDRDCLVAAHSKNPPNRIELLHMVIDTFKNEFNSTKMLQLPATSNKYPGVIKDIFYDKHEKIYYILTDVGIYRYDAENQVQFATIAPLPEDNDHTVN